MKKTALCLILLLALTGCSVTPAGDMEPPEPSAPALEDESRPTPTPDDMGKPEPTLPPEAGETRPTPPPPENAGPAARLWCEENRDRFSNAQWYAADRALWFAPYTDGTAVPAGVYYYEDATGAQTPEQIAAVLAEQAAAAGELFTAVPPVNWDGVAGLAAARGESGAKRSELSARMERIAPLYPGLGEEMWLCGWAGDGPGTDAYVMMRAGNVYRLQQDSAFGSYAVLPEVQVIPAFEQAAEACFGWMLLAGIPRDEADVRPAPEAGGSWRYFRVDYPGISSMVELRAYLKTLFSDDVVDSLLSFVPGDGTMPALYRDFDGALYVLDVDAGGSVKPALSRQIIRESDTRVVYRLSGETTADYVYERVGDVWIFTSFPFGA